nr:uncharacterized protein si:ch211-11p18.6 isoform X4 [Danio rerio]|eukprot:XP_021325099.1 uncharacterized protein si:ch211-11p18.6 isoform X4 [Danio rerio]
MSNNNLQDSGVKLLCTALKNVKCELEVLRISYCSISGEGYKALASALRSNPSHLIELDLRGNDPGQSGVKELTELLQDPHCTLKTLRFLSPAADEGCQFVTGILGKNPLLLKELNLSDCELGDTGVNQLSALLQDKHCKPKTLMLRGCGLKEETCSALATVLGSDTSLKELDMSNNNLQDLGVKKLQSGLENTNCTLEKLSLSDCSISEEGYKALASALRSNPSHLIELDLRGNDPGQSGVKELIELLQDPLCTLKTLRFLSPAADEACQFVTGIVGKNLLLLKELNLSDRQLGDTRVNQLSALLQDKHCTLNTLMLNNNRITAEGCAALTSAFNLNPSNLMELTLSGNKLEDSGVEKICSLLKNTQCRLKKLSLSDCRITEEGYKSLTLSLKSNSHLIELDLRGNDPGQSGVKELTDLQRGDCCKLKTVRFLKSSAAQEACDYLTKAVGKSPLLLTKLDLSEVKLGDLDGEKLSALLKDSHSKVEKIKLNNCELTEKSCSVLAAVLSSKTILKEMNLNNSRLLDSGVREICEGLKNPVCELKILNLSDCSISEEGYKALASALRSNPSHLIELDLRGNDPGQSGVKKLTDLLQDPHCTLNTLRFLSPAAEEACQFVTGIVGKNPILLKELNLSDHELGDTRVNQLSALLQDKHCKLNTLILKNSFISEEDCRVLAEAFNSNPSNLRELNLNGTKLTNSGMKSFNTLFQNQQCRLEKLKFSGISITAEGCAALTSAFSSNPSHLIELNLSGNTLEDSGVTEISSLLANSQCMLKILSLSDCSISEEGYKALASALRSNPSHLIELDLRGNDPGQSGVKELTALIPECALKTLRFLGPAAEEACQFVTGIVGKNPLLLKELNLSDRKLGDTRVNQLSALLQDKHCKPNTLQLNNNRITAEGCAALTSAFNLNPSHLIELNLSGNKLRDSGVEEICPLLKNTQCRLERLSLSDCSISEEGYKALASALRSNPSHLIELDLRGNDPGQSGVKELTDLLQDERYRLKTLRLLKTTAAQEACDYLTKVVGKSPLLLTELDLSEDKLGDLDGEKLSALLMDSHSKVEKIKLNNCKQIEKGCSVLAAVLSSKTILKEMNLNNSRLLDSGVLEICEGLKNPVCELKILKLSKCDLTEESCSALASVLRSDSSSLKDLDLSNNNLQDSGVKLLSDGLKHSKLKRLSLSDCSISEEGYKALASALRSNPSHLIELDLRGNDPGQSGVKELTDLLQDPHCTLKTLSCFSPAADEGCQFVTGIVGKNPLLLKELNLSDRELGDTRVNQLSALLQDKHCTLNILTLNNNRITAEGCAALTSAFNLNPSHLIELNLSGNKLGDSGVEKICPLLKNTQCRLEKLNLSDCSITGKGYETLISALKSNSHLIELDLRGNDPGKSGVQKLTDLLRAGSCKLKTIRTLKGSAAQEACDYLTKAVGKSPLLLTELDLSEDKLGDLDGEKLSALLMDSHSKVEKIRMNNCKKLTEKSCLVLAAVLSSKTILKEMNLNNSRLLDSGVKVICEGLKNSKLEILKLSNCSITEEGYKALASALRSNPSHLIELDLRGNDPGQSGVKELTELLQSSWIPWKKVKCSMRFLSPAADEFCQFVSGIVGKNPLLLKELNLSDHVLADTQVNQLSALLQDKHCKLNTLILSDCSISGEGYKALASALRSNPSHLIELDLRGNDPGQSGVKELTELLQDPHCTLKTLRFLSDDADEACEHLYKVLGGNLLLLRELNLTKHDLGPSGLEKLAAVLKDKHCKLNTLILNNSTISEEDFHVLTEAFNSNPTNLTELNLSGTKLTNSGMKSFTTLFQNQQCRLEKLKFSSMCITAEGCAALTSAFNSNPSHLKELNLSGNKLGDSGVRKISSLLRNSQCMLKILGLSDCSISEEGYKALASALRSNPLHLIELDLRGNDPGPSGVKELTGLLLDPHCTLTTLRFLSPAADEFCQFVSGIVGKYPLLLKELNLSDRGLGDTRVNQLSALLQDKHFRLNTLMLNNNRITAEGCAALTSAFNLNPSHLIELNLSGNKLEDSGVEKICPLLENIQCRLEKLSLSDCSIREEGYKALASALRSNPSHLIELDLRGNDPGQSGVKELTDLLQSRSCKFRFLKSSAAQEACEYLTNVLGISPLLLTELDLSEVKLGDLDWEKLSALLMDSHSKVEKIKLNNCELTEKSCSVLAAVLSSKTILKELNLNNSRLLDSGVRKICEGLKNPVCELKILNLSDCSITEEGYEALASALRSNPSHLIELDLRGNDPGQSGVKELTELLQDPHCALKTLRFLRSPAADEGCQLVTGVVGKNPLLLKELNLSDHELGDTRVNQLSALLQDKHCQINTLNLSYCSITEKQCEILTSALKSNPSHLRELDLSGNELGDFQSLGSLLKNQQFKLEKLILCVCSIKEKQCEILTSALKSNPSHLRELNLSGNELKHRRVKQFFDVLKKSTCKLERLRLRYCSIQADDCTDLASALKSNPSHLRELDLSGNNLGDSGVKKLSDLLINQQFKLEKLRLSYCSITEKQCVILTSALKSNPSHLRELNLNGNRLGDSGADGLNHLLSSVDCKLNKLHLCDCSITEKQLLIPITATCMGLLHLRELDLSKNQIKNQGVYMLCDVLKNPRCRLKRLRLNDCGITDVTPLTQSLTKDKALKFLKELELSKNQMGFFEKQKLSDLLRDSNCKLRLEEEEGYFRAGVKRVTTFLMPPWSKVQKPVDLTGEESSSSDEDASEDETDQAEEADKLSNEAD